MSEPSEPLPALPALPTPVEAADETYKPISGFALAGLGVSAAFAALVLLSAGIGVVLGSPIFYPNWFLIAPIAGFVLAIVGRSQIVGAESTRAGLRVAHWGMGLALFSGLGYVAYVFAIGMAVTAQANEFVAGESDAQNGFLTHLAKQTPADVDLAFLLTRPAANRIKLRGRGDADLLRTSYDQPGPDGGPGELTRFRSSLLVRLLGRAGPQAKIASLGVRDWTHDKSSYKVAGNYKVVTPEAELELVVVAESTEGEKEGQLRQWYVNLGRLQLMSRELTKLGKAVDGLRELAHRFADGEMRIQLSQGKAFADVAKADMTDWTALVPDSGDHVKKGKNVHRAVWQKQARSLFTAPAGLPYFVINDPLSWPLWGRDDQGRFWLDLPFLFRMPGDAETPPASGDGRIRMRTKAPLDPSQAALPFPAIEWEPEFFVVDRIRSMAPGMR